VDVKLTKQQLKQLAERRGQIDEDSGKVYSGFVGTLVLEDRLYHGEIGFDQPEDEREYVTFKISDIIKPNEATDGDPYTSLGSYQ